MKIEPDHLVPRVDYLIARMEEHRPSKWYVVPSIEQYIEESEEAISLGYLHRPNRSC